MRYVPCTIEMLHTAKEDFWIITVPVHALDDAARLFSELLSGIRKRIVFLDRKTECTLTAESVTCCGRSIPITKNFLECLKKLFYPDIRPSISHLDWDFSDRHGNIGISVFIQ